MLASEEVQAALNLPGVVIHCFDFRFGGIKIENTDHCTTKHRYLVAATGKTIKLAEYNSMVFLTLELGQWNDEVSWKNTEKASTDVLLNHPGYINSRAGGAGGSEVTCDDTIEFLLPVVHTLWRPNFKPIGAQVGRSW